MPKDSFDLAHARLVLVHLPEREQALQRMISSLKSGGCILIEDFDSRGLASDVGASYLPADGFGPDYHPRLGTGPTMSTELFRKMLQARGRVMSIHGSDITYVRRLHVMLISLGLKDVGIEGRISSWRVGTAGAKLEKANFVQSGTEILETGIVTEQEFAETLKLLDDPEWVRISLLMVSAWGRRKP